MDKKNTDYVYAVADYTILHLQQLKDKGIKRELSFPLQCGELENFNFVNIETAPAYEQMFRALKESSGPVLYWFEMTAGTDTKAVIQAFQTYKLKGEKNVPALRRKIQYETNTLYVGKVKAGISGRIVTHLGYFKVIQTQGLQLYHWAKPLNLCLTLQVLEFEQGMEDILPVFEYSFSKELRPLIGKHT
jgi:hypothetical protein